MENGNQVTKLDSWSGPNTGLRSFGEGAYTSLNLSEAKGKIKFVQSQQSPCRPLGDYINQVVEIQDILIHPATSWNEATSTEEHWQRIVLFLSDGAMIECGSLGIKKSIGLGMVLFGAFPWAGVKGKITQQQLSGQRRWYVIEWLIEDEQCQSEETGRRRRQS